MVEVTSVYKYMSIVLFALILLVLGAPHSTFANEVITHTFYYFDYAYILTSRNTSTAYYDFPINYSDGSVNQTVNLVEIGGDAEVLKENEIGITARNNTYGYFVLRVRQNYINSSRILNDLFSNPTKYNFTVDEIPEEIREEYLKPYLTLVTDVAIPEFEEWVRQQQVNLSQVSKPYIGILAAFFIYGEHFITYKASPVPRTISEVIENREGDCDDMSRVLLNILWFYGIPAKIQYGYVYLPYNETVNLEGSLMNLVNAGPHGYVKMYIPQIGWISLDFLAGSEISRPVLITGESVKTNVTEEDVENITESMKELLYAEIIMAYEEGELPEYLEHSLNEGTINSTLYKLVSPLIEEILGEETPTTTTTQPSETTTTTSIVTTTTTTEETTITTEPPPRPELESGFLILILMSLALGTVAVALLLKRLRS